MYVLNQGWITAHTSLSFIWKLKNYPGRNEDHVHHGNCQIDIQCIKPRTTIKLILLRLPCPWKKLPNCCVWNAEMMKPISPSLQPSWESRKQNGSVSLHLANTQGMFSLQGKVPWDKVRLPLTTWLLFLLESRIHHCSEMVKWPTCYMSEGLRNRAFKRRMFSA